MLALFTVQFPDNSTSSVNVAAIYLHVIICLERFNQRVFLINEPICLLNECVKSNVPIRRMQIQPRHACVETDALKQSALSRVSGPNRASICAPFQRDAGKLRYRSAGGHAPPLSEPRWESRGIKWTPRTRDTQEKHTDVSICDKSRERRSPSVVAPSSYQPLTANRSLMFDGHPVRSTL